jgi:hypothetical protein
MATLTPACRDALHAWGHGNDRRVDMPLLNPQADRSEST